MKFKDLDFGDRFYMSQTGKPLMKINSAAYDFACVQMDNGYVFAIAPDTEVIGVHDHLGKRKDL